MKFVSQFIDLFLHLDKHLSEIIDTYGTWTYAILFVIVFCETGLIVTPFLPGDSLLFAVGAFAAKGSLDLTLLVPMLIVAAVFGDAVNYACGHFIGPKVFRYEGGWILRREYLDQTRRVFEKYGAKAVVIARFIPIVRTFAPFLAGVGRMNYVRFAIYNVVGGVSWVLIFLFAGYAFGNIPVVQKNFTLVILGIIFVSILPTVYEYVRARRENREQELAKSEAPPP